MVFADPLPTTGYGLLGLTWRPKQTPDEQAFSAMKAAIANGATVWSSSSLYGTPPEGPTAGMTLLRRYFEKYPEDAPKVTLFIRACLDADTMSSTNSRAEVRASVEHCNRLLGGAKKMDIFGPARMDRNVPVEETVGALKELVDEGQIGSVGLSEVGAETIRKAHAICPLAVVEVEFSLWSTDILTNGVAATCKELGVPILTYAPLGYGFLTGQVKKVEDIAEGDMRRMLSRFQPENFHKNLDLVDKIKTLAKQRGVSPAQLALAWIRGHSNTGDCGVIIPIPGATAAERVEENCYEVSLSAEEKGELDRVLASFKVSGGRQIDALEHQLWG
ncbi:hypothetical protein AK830_g961 [Neonectria ditissima]|uniref:NADP-dependent oxidoreductase domain-containing protein n=1 Tax=Neonectria ditissima TaxID=78410 RepID=A0A0P7B6Q2_9HYPO|nr:hypothetical protein AK830_g961 [Neonectria ditissima]